MNVINLGKFDQQTVKELEDQININVNAITFMSHKVIPLFLERKKKCAIINLSSQSVQHSLRKVSVYTATKAYDSLFSHGLTQDYQGKIHPI